MSRGRKVGSAYPSVLLNRIFMVSSALLLFSTAWMFWDDYDRPWKHYQREFITRQRARAEQALANLDLSEAKQEELDTRRKEAAADREKNAEEIAKLETRKNEVAAQLFPVDQTRKFKKAGVDTYRYKHDHARYQLKKYDMKHAGEHHDNDAERTHLLAEVATAESELAERIHQFNDYTLKTQRLEADMRAVDAELGRYSAIDAAIGKAQTKLTAESDQIKQRIKELDQGPWFETRNAPFLDMLAPNIKIVQVVLPDYKININFAKIQTVDRCMTCHVAVDKTGWDLEEKVALAEKVESTHLSQPEQYAHLVERFGKANVSIDASSTWDEAAEYTVDELLEAVDRYGAVQVVSTKGSTTRVVAAKDLPRYREAFGARAVEARDGGKITLTLPTSTKAKPRLDYVVSHPVEHPYRGHSRLDTYVGSTSAHPMNTFGCTACHAGAGEATDFQRAVHTPEHEAEMARWKHDFHWKATDDKYWNRPMFPSQHIEAGCVQCHASVVEFEPMPWTKIGAAPVPAVAWAKGGKGTTTYAGQHVQEAQNLFLDHGCNGCHKVEAVAGEPKIGPGLMNLAVKLDRQWVRRWIENPRGFRAHTRMPQVFKVPHQLDPLADVDSLREDFGSYLGSNPDESVGAKQVEALTAKYPKRKQQFAAIMDAEMDAIVAYLFEHSGRIQLATPPISAVADKGKALFLDKGCLACHVMNDYKVDGQPDKRFGPDLSNVASKLNPDNAVAWLNTWLLDPEQYHKGARMPNVRLTPDEAGHLAAYLATKKGADTKTFFDFTVTPADEALVRMRLVNFLEGNVPTSKAWEIVDALSPKQRMVWLGEKVIAKQGCFGCHAMAPGGVLENDLRSSPKAWSAITAAGAEKLAAAADFNSMAGIGVELSDWGAKLMSKLEFGLQKHLEPTRWTFARVKVTTPRIYDEGMFKAYDDLLRMPWFGFDDGDASKIATYVSGLSKKELDVKYDYLHSPLNWKTRMWEQQTSIAREPLADKRHQDWSPADASRFEGMVARLKSYELDRADTRKYDALAKRLRTGTPQPGDVLDIALLQHKYEGELDPTWSNSSDRRRAIVEGRKLVRRHNCRGCHQIEGRGGELSVFIDAFRFGGQGGTTALEESPPFLNHEGERVQASWLFGFLRDPAVQVGEPLMRRWLTMRMPNYGLTVVEANVLTRYFAALSGTSWPSNDSWGTPTDDEVKAATEMVKDKKCLTCHGNEVTGTRSAPWLDRAGSRLNPEWVRRWLMDPKLYLPYTSMIEDALKADGAWVNDAHAAARKHVRVLMHGESVAKIRKELGN